MRALTALFLLFPLIRASQGQQTDLPTVEERAEACLKQRGEVYFQFVLPASATPGDYAAFLSIDRVSGDTVTAYAGSGAFRKFTALKQPYHVLVPPSLRHRVTMAQTADSTRYRRYLSYAAYVSLMQQLADDYPDICRLRQFGTTPNGHGLYVLKISDHPGDKETEPDVFYTSSMHGDELTGFVLMLRLSEYLLSHYATDARIRDLIDETEIWINPLFNPDGAYFTADTTVYGATRYNSAGVDLNRNFPDIADADTSDDDYQPENRAMMRLLQEVRPVLGANFHGGVEVVNFPWDTWGRLHPDDEWYRYISRCYADTVHAHARDGYFSDFENGITNGYDWYQVIGGRQDYVNYFLHGREVTVELTEEHTPPEEDLEAYWNYNYRSLLDFIGQSHQGFSITVTDSLTGEPLSANAVLLGHDWDNSFTKSDPATGRLYRLVLPGSYLVSVNAEGYHTRTYHVGVAEHNMTEFPVRLFPVVTSTFYPNPFSFILQMYLYDPGENLTMEFTDLTGRVVQRIEQPVVFSGLQTIAVKPMASGLYVVTLNYRNTHIRSMLFRE
jgi:hypothetical protein